MNSDLNLLNLSRRLQCCIYILQSSSIDYSGISVFSVFLSFSTISKRLIFFAYQDEYSVDVMNIITQISSFSPSIVAIKQQCVEDALQRSLNENFIVVSHPGVITKEIIRVTLSCA